MGFNTDLLRIFSEISTLGSQFQGCRSAKENSSAETGSGREPIKTARPGRLFSPALSGSSDHVQPADYNRYGASSVVLCGIGPKAPVETVIGGQEAGIWVLGIALGYSTLVSFEKLPWWVGPRLWGKYENCGKECLFPNT